MTRVGDMFSSKARTEILRVLEAVRDGVGIRQAARLAGVHPHSAELVLAKLSSEGLVTIVRSSNRNIYQLNRDHHDVPILEAVFSAAVNAAIRVRSRALQERGRSILPFITDASGMLKKARGSMHVA